VCISHFSYKAVREFYCNIISSPSGEKSNTITYFLSCERLLLYYQEKRSELRRKTNNREADDSNEKEMILHRSNLFLPAFPILTLLYNFFLSASSFCSSYHVFEVTLVPGVIHRVYFFLRFDSTRPVPSAALQRVTMGRVASRHNFHNVVPSRGNSPDFERCTFAPRPAILLQVQRRAFSSIVKRQSSSLSPFLVFSSLKLPLKGRQ
jgi:hypothetical protein